MQSHSIHYICVRYYFFSVEAVFHSSLSRLLVSSLLVFINGIVTVAVLLLLLLLLSHSLLLDAVRLRSIVYICSTSAQCVNETTTICSNSARFWLNHRIHRQCTQHSHNTSRKLPVQRFQQLCVRRVFGQLKHLLHSH